MSPTTDYIEKRVVLRAPRERVWRAVSEAKQFGTWFGVEFTGEFAAGIRITGRLTGTKVDPQVAKLQQSHLGLPFEFHIERIEPMSLFSFRWHPNAVDARADYSAEPMTLVEFRLEDAAQGTLLIIKESGFDRIPLGRRASAFANNEGGWTHQCNLIEKYLAQDRA
jgi:uncharacterized protein YndB with AHSA1/START domain